MGAETSNQTCLYHQAEPSVDVWTGMNPAQQQWPEQELLNTPARHTLDGLSVHVEGVSHLSVAVQLTFTSAESTTHAWVPELLVSQSNHIHTPRAIYTYTSSRNSRQIQSWFLVTIITSDAKQVYGCVALDDFVDTWVSKPVSPQKHSQK